LLLEQPIRLLEQDRRDVLACAPLIEDPSPRAITPRSTSRVPPRKVKDGARMVTSASTSDR
jgi:hypothetical protein